MIVQPTAFQNFLHRQYCMIQMKNSKMPETSVVAAKPVKESVKSSLMLLTQDLVGLPSVMGWDQ